MDAGNFNLNFGNVGGPNRFQKTPGPNQNQDPGRGVEEKGPRDQVNLGDFPFAQAGPDLHSTEQANETTETVVRNTGIGRTEQAFSLSGPLMVDSVNGVNAQSFSNTETGITALNGVNSTSLFTLGGSTIASLSPFSPTTAIKVPTTSVSTNGIESTEFVTSSGRVIDLNGPLTVKMPTTSVSTNGIEDTSWFTTSGREISV